MNDPGALPWIFQPETLERLRKIDPNFDYIFLPDVKGPWIGKPDGPSPELSGRGIPDPAPIPPVETLPIAAPHPRPVSRATRRKGIMSRFLRRQRSPGALLSTPPRSRQGNHRHTDEGGTGRPVWKGLSVHVRTAGQEDSRQTGPAIRSRLMEKATARS
jgi:hypothetical protein